MSNESKIAKIAKFIHENATKTIHRMTLQYNGVATLGCAMGSIDKLVNFLECCGSLEKTMSGHQYFIKTTPTLQYLIEIGKIDMLYKACYESMHIKFWPNYETDPNFKNNKVILTSDKKRLLVRFITVSPRFQKFYDDVGAEITKVMKNQFDANQRYFIKTTNWLAKKLALEEAKKAQKTFLNTDDEIISIGSEINAMSDMSETVRGITESILTQNAVGDIVGTVTGTMPITSNETLKEVYQKAYCEQTIKRVEEAARAKADQDAEAFLGNY